MDARAHQVFLVDDDAAVRDSIRALLESYGIQVHDYASGADFLAEPRDNGCGCLIMDMHMPGMNGLELLGAMRAKAWWLPVIAITGKADAHLIANLRNAGACAVFEKPIDEAILLQAIENAVAH